ncbi:RES family NAD+ phosphorylase [Ferruginivarius sediminum]|uniref:RES family NAD+ phosphorylase n=1 Tax=Ferruginivarius sediminum TaxID=2661937 RepID=UPI001F4E5A4B|nr:RES family NAD+ phosphorylase [Ferruginivarius sediminum]
MSLPDPPLRRVAWPKTHRIIRSRFPPIDLFEDIADPADWPLIAAGEARTNPRLSESVGNLDLVPPERRVGGAGASWVMAPFVHVSTDRPGRFTDGTWGVYSAGDRFEVALFETVYHHGRFMARTAEPPGWTSEFRELIGSIDAELHDLRGDSIFTPCLDPDDYSRSQSLARRLRQEGADGVVYPSVRYPDGDCIAAFWPDVVTVPTQGRHLAYHWNGGRVDRIKDASAGLVYAVEP